MELLKNKNFMLVFLGRIVSFLGDHIQDIVIMWYILQQSNSAFIAGISLFVNTIPKVIFSPISGILADFKNKRDIMVICDLFNGVLAITLGVVVIYKPEIYIILIITFIMSTLDTFFATSSSSIIPSIVNNNQLAEANSLSEISSSVIKIGGPILGGFLFTLFRPEILFFINGISFLISSLSEFFIRYPYVKKKIVREKRQSLFWEGLKEIRSNKFLLFAAIIGGGLINLFLAPISLYIPIYVRDYMKQSSLHFGLLTAIIPIGGILCSIVILKKNKMNMAELVVAGFILQGMAMVLFGLSYELLYAYAALCILGISLTLTSIGMQTVIQRTIPEECLGRSMGSIMMIASISVPMGYLFGGLLLEYMPLNVILRVSGLIISIIGGYSYFILKDTIDFKIDHVIEKQG